MLARRRTGRCIADRPNLMLGLTRCLGFGGTRIDAAVAAELVRAVEPLAVEAALQAGRMHMESQTERNSIAELELQQARYEAGLAERRYTACDPDNRIAYTDDLGAETTPRPAQRLTFVGHIASESQTQSRPLPHALPGRAPDAF